MITYEEFLKKETFNFQEILAFTHGNLIKDPPNEILNLPSPPFLMFDRVLEIKKQLRGGKIVAEQDVKLDAWFFQCHFRNDPVQPGCLGVDAVWQLTGLWGSVMGGVGTGRALGAKEISFNGQIRPHNKIVRYELIDLKIIKTPNQSVCMGNANVYVDNKLIYEIKGQKIGLYHNIKYSTYPWEGQNGEEK